MKPEKILEMDYEHYVYAKCECPVPMDCAIKIPKVKDKHIYHFNCEDCGCSGEVVSKYN